MVGSKVTSLDIFDTQEVLEFVWDHYESQIIKQPNGVQKLSAEHEGASIHLWCSFSDVDDVDSLHISHKDFSVAGIWGDVHYCFHYAGDRQELANWLVEWKLLM